ncbi:helix-turn-helix domain-containing protein [Nonomuraea wenchangensis]|uniref:DNA binding domain-containing protein, excisionase family n=1 Tax=Nonomuraea wenchangensis TaxID=568860 RepID=A0A1I0LGJ1_9ACTN|nr:helix-turn-helix domain-containing protein [Nonomuraea wenchangensis]SEU38683.1 DNA binding domain-containing protein, excisionase family [Nonomuraea wenchangensis]
MSDVLVTAEQAADAVGVTKSAIHVWVHRGRLKHVKKDGKKHLYRLADVFEAERLAQDKYRHKGENGNAEAF